MADPREWPGFRVDVDPRWKRHRGRGDTVRAAQDDITYPQAVVHRDKQPTRQANAKVRQTAAGDALTRQGEWHRKALARGDRSTLTETDHVMSTVIRFVPGGRQTVLALIQRAMRNHDPDATAWWSVYADLLAPDQKHVSLDVICEASGVAPDRLMAVVVSTAMRAGADAAELVAATTYPHLIRQTVKSAQRIGGEYAAIAQKDREFLLQHHKFVPTPKGGSVFVGVNANASAQAAAAAQSQPSVPTFADSLESARYAHQAVQDEVFEGDIEDR